MNQLKPRRQKHLLVMPNVIMKNFKTILIVLFFGTFSTETFSQNCDTIQTKPIILTTSLFDYLPSWNLPTSNLNIGAEIYLSNRNSIFLNCGLIRPCGHAIALTSPITISTKGFKLQFETKHFLNKHKLLEPMMLIFWPHIFQYKSQTLQNTGYYYAIHTTFQKTATDRKGYKNSIYTVDRTFCRLDFKIGYQCIKRCGLAIDCAFGLGIKYLTSNSRNYIQDSSWPNNDKDFPWNKLFDTGAGLYPDIVYQLRLGWGF
jgi:hypothetical protein